MSPELGIALFVTLIWGPTLLWVGYRTLRGHRGPNGFWVCGTCRSLNRREANRCYGCRTAMSSAVRQAPGELQDPGELLVSRGVPVMADGIARSSGEAAGTTVTLATPRNASPAPEILVRDPERVLSAAPREAPVGVPVCPFLGFKSDPSTRCDFPDPRNLCHATSERGAMSLAPTRRFVTGIAGARRPQPIGAEHQKSRCLTATHGQCARYPAVELVAANR
jgi:hypothetical protein